MESVFLSDNCSQVAGLLCTCTEDVVSVSLKYREPGANLLIFEAVIELARISMHISPYISLKEIKEEGKSEWQIDTCLDRCHLLM